MYKTTVLLNELSLLENYYTYIRTLLLILCKNIVSEEIKREFKLKSLNSNLWKEVHDQKNLEKFQAHSILWNEITLNFFF